MSDQEIFRQRGAYLVPDVAPCVTAHWAKGTGGPAGDECQNLVVFTQNDAGRDACVDVAPTLRSGHGGGAVNQYVCLPVDIRNAIRQSDNDVTGKAGQGNNMVLQYNPVYHYIVRRLTPRECERLQGFPDDWTLIPWRGKPAADCPDSHRYKATGNSMAVPVMWYIGRRIQIVERRGHEGLDR